MTREATTTIATAMNTLGTARVALRALGPAGGAGGGTAPGALKRFAVLAGPISMRIPRGRIIKSITITPTQKRTRPTNGWKTLIAMDSPHSLPAKKIKVMRARL